jgi:hypothetical protein
VITQDYGLLGRLVDEFHLGIAVDTTDPSEIAGAIAATVRRGPDTLADVDGMKRFLDGRSSTSFADILLDGTRCDAAAPSV